jgi:hypothetical protein
MDEQVPGGSIVITPKEFYDGVRSDISEIKAAVSPLPELKHTVEKQGERLGRLERVAWIALGVALASGSNDLLPLLAR